VPFGNKYPIRGISCASAIKVHLGNVKETLVLLALGLLYLQLG